MCVRVCVCVSKNILRKDVKKKKKEKHFTICAFYKSLKQISEIKKKIEKSLKRSALSIKKAKPKPAAAAAVEEEAEAEAAHKINNFV